MVTHLYSNLVYFKQIYLIKIFRIYIFEEINPGEKEQTKDYTASYNIFLLLQYLKIVGHVQNRVYIHAANSWLKKKIISDRTMTDFIFA